MFATGLWLLLCRSFQGLGLVVVVAMSAGASPSAVLCRPLQGFLRYAVPPVPRLEALALPPRGVTELRVGACPHRKVDYPTQPRPCRGRIDCGMVLSFG